MANAVYDKIVTISCKDLLEKNKRKRFKIFIVRKTDLRGVRRKVKTDVFIKSKN